MSRFSIGEAVGYSWKTFWQRPWFFIGLAIIPLGLSFVSGFITGDGENTSTFGWLLYMIILIFTYWLSAGILKVLLQVVDGRTGVFSELFSVTIDQLVKYLLTSILVGIIVLAGTFLFIVPGIIWSLKYLFAPYVSLDKNIGPTEALKLSGQITAGSRWKLLGWSFVSAGISLLGMLALFVGLFIAVPIVFLAQVAIYRTLLRSVEAQPSETGKTSSA